jgi:hypothetical protein
MCSEKKKKKLKKQKKAKTKNKKGNAAYNIFSYSQSQAWINAK